MKLKLFEFRFRVHPNELHPSCGEIKFGILVIWRLDHDLEAAIKIACAIAVSLPYHVGGMKAYEIEEDGHLLEYQSNGVPMARLIGMNLALFHWGHDVDEELTLHHFPYLVPPLPPRSL